MNLQPPIPILRFFDETKAREFYVDYLGFKVDWEHRFEPHMPLYFQVSRDACVLHLSEHHGDGTPGTKIRIACPEVEAYHQALTAKPYRHLNPGLESPPWSEAEMTLTDPFGNALIFYKPE
ncbi:MAG: glyoxalase superfamily protein [Bacteroidota bacterium]